MVIISLSRTIEDYIIHVRAFYDIKDSLRRKYIFGESDTLCVCVCNGGDDMFWIVTCIVVYFYSL